MNNEDIAKTLLELQELEKLTSKRFRKVLELAGAAINANEVAKEVAYLGRKGGGFMNTKVYFSLGDLYEIADALTQEDKNWILEELKKGEML